MRISNDSIDVFKNGLSIGAKIYDPRVVNARPDKNGPQKTPDLILEDLTRTDQIEAMEKAGPENDGRNPLTVKF